MEHEEIFKAHHAELRRFLSSRISSYEEAEDMVQEIFAKLLSRDLSRPPEEIRAWLFRAARNRLIDHYRKRSSPDPLPEELPDIDTSSLEEERDSLQEIERCLHSLAEELPRHYQSALFSDLAPNLTRKERALKEALSLTGLSSRILRAKEMVRRSLLQCCSVAFDSSGVPRSLKRKPECSRSC